MLADAHMNEMEPLDPLSKELLDAARSGHCPPAGGRDRVRHSIVLRVGASAFAGTALATASTAWLKVVVPLALLALGGGAYFVVHRPPAARPVPVLVAPAPVDTVASDLPVTPELTLPAVMEPTAVLAPPTPKPVATHQAAPFAQTLPTVSPAPPSIEAETSLLLAAQTSLKDGDGARALSLLDEHARRFPNGALGEERDATRVLALCATGRASEARAAGQAFLAAHPRSPAAARVRTSCGGT